MRRSQVPILGLAQDYSTNGWHASAYNSPVFNGKFMTTTQDSQYLQLHSGLAAAFTSITSFSSTVWVYVNTVGTFTDVAGSKECT
jgi:hypothetical protein